jgi:hypothetical protein
VRASRDADATADKYHLHAAAHPYARSGEY